MLSKAVNGYSASIVDTALRGIDAKPLYRIRGELLDLDNVKLYDIVGLEQTGGITHNVEQPLQRGATLNLLETDRRLLASSQTSYLGTFASLITKQARLFHLRMNETSGSSAADYSGNGRAFTITATVTFSQAALGIGDVADNSFKLDGSTARLDIAYSSWMNVGTFTIAGAWKGTGVSQTLFDRDNGSTQRVVRIGVDASGFLFASINFTSGTAYTTFTTTALINDGNPHLIHVRYDKTSVQVYVDGRRVLKTAETRAVSAPTAQGIRIGATGAGANFSSGTFDEWGMVARPISPAEVRNEYQAWSAQTKELLFDKDRGDRLRIYYGIAMPTAGTDGTYWAEWARITALLTTARDEYTQTGRNISLSCQDQTRILADDTFATRWTLGNALNYITAPTVLSGSTPIGGGVLAIAQSAGLDTSAWATTLTALITPTAIDFEIGTSKLDAINQLLQFINYRSIRFAGDGTGILEANVLDKDRSLSDTFISNSQSIISAQSIPIEIAQRSVPNQITVFNGNPDAVAFVVSATNSKVNSPTSTVNLQSTNLIAFQVDAPDSTTAQGIANQILNDQSARFAQKLTLEMMLYPILDDRDRVRFTLSQVGIDSDYIVFEWREPLNPLERLSLTVLSVVDVT